MRVTGMTCVVMITVSTVFVCVNGDRLRHNRDVTYDTDNKKGPVLKVTSFLTKPYLMVRNASSIGNDRYEGFIADFVQELSELKSYPFQYEIHIVKDGKYGTIKPDSNWTGMIGEVQRGEMDLAVAPLTITPSRQNAVKFTKPFLDIHATMLMKRTPKDEENPIQSLNDLLNQTDRTFGWKSGSPTEEAFRSSTESAIRQAWPKMYSSGITVTSNEDGYKRAREGYVFITENIAGEYVANQKPCDLMTVGNLVEIPGYGIAVSIHNTTLHKEIDKSVEKLKSVGQIAKLYTKWWYEQGCEPYGPRVGQSTDSATFLSATLSLIAVCKILTSIANL